MKNLLILAGILTLGTVLARAEDWTTTDGTTYQDVKVLSHDDGYVTIMYADGGARVPLNTLPPDLQKRFNYIPAKAAAAEAATATADKRDLAARREEQTNAPSLAATPLKLAASSPPLNVVPAQAPAASPAPRMSGRQVDVLGNNMRIERDQEELDGMIPDLQRAQREAMQEDNHVGFNWDNSSRLHPNAVGATGDQRVAEIQKSQSVLQAEIDRLKSENQSATKTAK